MKSFNDLLEAAELFEENTRDKAKGFKKQIRPFIKKVKDAQVGDPRRYAYMLVWPFLRDVLKVPDMQGQDTPKNSALIQRKLEDLSDAGDLPEDAAEQFTKYAEEQFDQHVDTISVTKRKSSPKSHVRGKDVKTRVAVAGGGTGFTEKETASERAERNRVEAELRAKQEAEGGGEEKGEDRLKQIGIDVDSVEAEFKNAVTDIADTLQPADTTLIEVIGRPGDGPIVQKQQIIDFFQGELVEQDNFEKTSGYANLEFEIKADSKYNDAVQQMGAEKFEQLLSQRFSEMLGRDIQVIVHAPETEDFIKPIDDSPRESPYTDEDEQWSDPYAGQRQERHEGDTVSEVILPQGKYEVYFKGGKVIKVEGPDSDFNLVALNSKLSKGHQLKDALLTTRNTRRSFAPVMDSVMDYMPTNDGEYKEPVILETTRQRLSPKTNHQMDEYRKLLGE